jgi:U3 small nucleolar RNA-associated protein 21
MSLLFSPYRAVGFVCDETPAHFKRMGSERFVTVAIGKAWQTFNLDKLRLVQVSPPRAQPVRAVASFRDVTFTAHGAQVVVWRRTREEAALQGHEAAVRLLSLFGDTLLSLDEEGRLLVWNVRTLERVGELRFASAQGGRRVTCLAHPHTYLNKVLVGFDSGDLELWNVRSGKLIYAFDPRKWAVAAAASARGAVGPAAVLCVQQSPAVDVVGVGLADGRAVLLNVRTDEVITSFRQSDGAVTALSFRSDGKLAAMATASPAGHVAVWDLDKRALHSAIRHAHTADITSLHFLPSEPVLVSAGADNALKMWAFDQLDGTARLLRAREGHSAPPTRIRFFGDDGDAILSAGLDRSLRSFHVLRDRQAHELSQGHLASKAARASHVRVEDLRLPPITDFAFATTRARDWSNLVSCHTDSGAARTWSTENKRLTDKLLRDPRRKGALAPATAVAVSACGHFALVGGADGRLERFNLQSGIFRASYGDDHALHVGAAHVPAARPAALEEIRRATDGLLAAAPASGPSAAPGDGHSAPVTGVASDALNRLVVSASIDGTLRFWDFETTKLIEAVRLDAPANQLVLHRDSDLLAVVTDSLVVGVFDINSRKLVRRFRGHKSRVSDVAFSSDGRWLATACVDGSLRVFDLASGRLLEWLTFAQPLVSIAFSPRGDFLATTHAGNLGIFLWANRAFFAHALPPVALDAPRVVDLPIARGDAAAAAAAEATEEEEEEEEDDEKGDRTDAARGGQGAGRVRVTSAGEAAAGAARGEGDEEAEDAALGWRIDKVGSPRLRSANASSSSVPAALPARARAPLPAASAPTAAAQAEAAAASCFASVTFTAEPVAAEEGLELITMSGLPRSRWVNLSLLDVIKARNKPIEPPKAPKQAPFFLSASLEHGAGAMVLAPAAAQDAAAAPDASGSRILRDGVRLQATQLLRLLRAAAPTLSDTAAGKRPAPPNQPAASEPRSKRRRAGSAEAVAASTAAAAPPPPPPPPLPAADVLRYLESLNPSAVDAELRLLGSCPEAEEAELGLMLRCLAAWVASAREFDFVQALLHLFLTIHGATLARHPALCAQAKRLVRVQRARWRHLENYLQGSLALVQIFSNTL